MNVMAWETSRLRDTESEYILGWNIFPTSKKTSDIFWTLPPDPYKFVSFPPWRRWVHVWRVWPRWRVSLWRVSLCEVLCTRTAATGHCYRDTWRSGRFFKCFCSWLFLPRKFRSWTKKHVVYITSWYKLWTLWRQFIALNSVKFKELCFSPWKRPRRTSVWCLSILWWSKRGDWKGQAVQGWQKCWQSEEVNKKMTASSWHVWDFKGVWSVEDNPTVSRPQWVYISWSALRV